MNLHLNIILAFIIIVIGIILCWFMVYAFFKSIHAILDDDKYFEDAHVKSESINKDHEHDIKP